MHQQDCTHQQERRPARRKRAHASGHRKASSREQRAGEAPQQPQPRVCCSRPAPVPAPAGRTRPATAAVQRARSGWRRRPLHGLGGFNLHQEWRRRGGGQCVWVLCQWEQWQGLLLRGSWRQGQGQRLLPFLALQLPPLLLLLLLPSPSSPSLLPPAPARAAEVALPRRRGCLCMRRKGPARLSAAAMRGRPRTWRAS